MYLMSPLLLLPLLVPQAAALLRACAPPRCSSPHLLSTGAAATTTSLPLFDPAGDEIPFPFPSIRPTLALDEEGPQTTAACRYAFDRPVYMRMLRALVPEAGEDGGEAAGSAVAGADGDDDPLFGHCVLAGDGEASSSLALGSASNVRVGTVGVALRARNIEFGASAGVGAAFGDEVAVVSALADFRFAVTEVERTIPYPVAAVRELRDEPAVDDAAAEATVAAEAEVSKALRRLIELSGKLEARGEAAEAAEAALEGPAALLAAHEEATNGALYASLTERHEAFSLAACGLVSMPHDAACEALATTSALSRLRLLLSHLGPALDELEALASLDGLGGGFRIGASGPLGGGAAAGAAAGAVTGAAAGKAARPSMLGGTTAFTPVDIPVGDDAKKSGEAEDGTQGPKRGKKKFDGELPEGARIEYWYNEDFGWIAATVKRKIKQPTGSVLHTLEFDVDGTWEDVSLEFSAGGRRWRPLR